MVDAIHRKAHHGDDSEIERDARADVPSMYGIQHGNALLGVKRVIL